MDRNAKARIMHLARALARPTEARPGLLTGKAIAVLEALKWGFHAKAGFCFPSYERIAERAGCAVSTVGPAIASLEENGLMTWRHRLKRVWDGARDATGVAQIFRVKVGCGRLQRVTAARGNYTSIRALLASLR
jgi:hypothetical protein